MKSSAKSRLQTAIHMIDEALPHAQSDGPMSASQLLRMRAALVSYMEHLDGGALYSNSPGAVLGRVIADSWPMVSQLGNAIVDAEAAYLCELKGQKR